MDSLTKYRLGASLLSHLNSCFFMFHNSLIWPSREDHLTELNKTINLPIGKKAFVSLCANDF